MSKMLGIALTVTSIFASTTAVLAQSRYVYGTPGWSDRADRSARAEYGSPNYVTNGGRYPFDRQLCCRF
jgi:hypothetical protein